MVKNSLRPVSVDYKLGTVQDGVCNFPFINFFCPLISYTAIKFMLCLCLLFDIEMLHIEMLD